MRTVWIVISAVVLLFVGNVNRALAEPVLNPDSVTVVRGGSATINVFDNDENLPDGAIPELICRAEVGLTIVIGKGGLVTVSVADRFRCPQQFNCSYHLKGIKGSSGLFTIDIVCPPDCPCKRFSLTDFGAPMGKKKKLGATIPVKFQLFFDGVEILSQEGLDIVLKENGCEPACPEIGIFDLTDEAKAVGIELTEDLTNVGEGGDLGFCFRYSAPNWIFNLGLPEDVFFSSTTYGVEVIIGNCILRPGNEIFQIK